MTRRSECINTMSGGNVNMQVTLLRDMLYNVNNVNGKNDKIKGILEIFDYILSNFNELKCSFYHVYGKSFKTFTDVLHNKIQNIIAECEVLLLKGDNIKMSLDKLRQYQSIYNKIYLDYQDNRLIEERSQIVSKIIEKKKIAYEKRSMEIKKYIKQILINKIPLCGDVLNIIKSYCFYDIKTFEQIKLVKSLKTNIVTMIKNSDCSRKNGFYSNEDGYYDDEDSDEVEHWAFCINCDEYALQAVNCKWCGNYSEEHSPTWVPQNILCRC